MPILDVAFGHLQRYVCDGVDDRGEDVGSCSERQTVRAAEDAPKGWSVTDDKRTFCPGCSKILQVRRG